MLVSNPHFVLEKFELPPDSNWRLDADGETWMLVLAGGGRTDSFSVATGDAVFLQADRADIDAGPAGLTGLLAYTGTELAPGLQRRSAQSDGSDAKRTPEAAFSGSLTQATEPARGCIETIQ